VKPYLAILSARFRLLLQYRAAAIAGFGTQLFWGFIRVMIFTAFFKSASEPQPMTLTETINYIWLGQALLLLLPWNMDREVHQIIRSGNVAYEMVRPLNLYWLWYVRELAQRVAPVILRAIPMFFIASIFLGLDLPPSFAAALAFGCSVLGAIFLSSAITTLLAISLFWTISGEGMLRLVPNFAIMFSGLVIPLPMFPDWSQPILNFLPFRGLMDVPFRLYLAHLPPEQATGLIAHQILWGLVFILLGRVLLQHGLKRVVVQGG
jgi:ABC-2 type transport system permease protein